MFGYMAPIQTFIHGSCVARDVIRVVPDPFRLRGYVARQTIASGFTKPATVPDLSHIHSAFQRRALEGDFSSDVATQIRAEARRTDIVLIDIASDRHGLAAIGGGYASTTPDHIRAFGGVVPGGRRIRFGTDRHLDLFRAGAERAARTLDRYSLRSLVLGFDFTQQMSDGSTYETSGMPADEINALYEPYYRLLEQTGFEISWLPTEHTLIDPDHKWGPGLDHFIEPAYQWWAGRIAEAAG